MLIKVKSNLNVMTKNNNLSTNCVHTNHKILPKGRRLYSIPVLDGSTVIFDEYEDFISSPIDENTADLHKITHTLQNYGRGGNETTLCVEQIISEFENADYCKILSTGLAAIRIALIAFTTNKSHILVTDGIYNPVRLLLNYLIDKFSITVTYFDPLISQDELMKLVQPNTDVIYCEVPATRFFEVANIDAIVNVAKKIGAVSICDNSYSTWINFKPLDNGFDVSCTSLTKYAAGHSDMLAGSVCVKEKHFRQIFIIIDTFGDHVTADNSAKLLRGIRTMDLRMNHSIKTGLEFIEYLKTNKKVSKIYHPSLKDHVGHDNFIKHFINAPSLLSIALDRIYTQEELSKIYSRFKLFCMGYSYGGAESLVIPLPVKNIRKFSKNQPSPNSSMRLYIGLENIDDLIADFENAIL